MKVIYGITNLPRIKNSIVTIGNFDGVHKAHRHIIECVIKSAQRNNSKSIAITFWPHTSQVTRHKISPLLTSLQHRIQLIKEMNPDYCFVLDFSSSFSKTPMEIFVKKILIDRLGMREIYIGEDFRFGKGRKGDRKKLIKLGERYNFRVNSVRALKIQGHKISSSLIRELIQDLKVNEAKKFLGRDVSLIGRVIKGDKRGRVIGFPTANIHPDHEVMPPDGIYAVKVFIGHRMFYGICYIGSIPTFKLSRRIEVHIFNFNRHIYRKPIEVRFIKFIRYDKKFSNKEALTTQIKLDILEAKKIFEPKFFIRKIYPKG